MIRFSFVLARLPLGVLPLMGPILDLALPEDGGAGEKMGSRGERRWQMPLTKKNDEDLKKRDVVKKCGDGMCVC